MWDQIMDVTLCKIVHCSRVNVKSIFYSTPFLYFGLLLFGLLCSVSALVWSSARDPLVSVVCTVRSGLYFGLPSVSCASGRM